ncbi:DUF456 domain-containing protein [Candidatus Nanohalobium constans]|uniref:DUF456 domain-containing protein n=1 Tax=Candidatus Nanohalobium constans TaxID=2565781 RepID=A0A5Q0UGJ1_9ARCH|nr:DUF456 domain-containing protein [Candidatus Nanohalobium constans]QGA80763.1 hypothetical protein LC1Nh_0880 [Candidatus Nanohalobium constans]
MEITTLIVIILLFAGVIGSIVPMAPGALFSLAGVIIYFFSTEDPSILFTVFGILTAGFTLLVDWFAGSIAAKYGGASSKTSLAAGIGGLIGFIVTAGNPLGLAAGVALTVLIREYLIHGGERDSLKAAVYATIGVLGSSIVQAVLTASILIAFLISMVI